ncbi:TPA: sodium:proton antiporter NhaD [Vibrio parahaemolyticus]|uniref:sodium:proton antiporter NhaD n=1 Tax=Vibrio parahaemolyticus TaxID=670 RepID=UPI00186977F7|nr:sodium:proton antiporter NhaD [Vibrio parahaemolyticus]EGQ8177592.1 sodium:proton antiporter [Vibrio parahaemolyticus]MBE3947302.1 sodium:proton antiporter [Vibrio parahaemolyticus]MBE4537270.1 sodium:proton antiporter [Vibrio parahaemolyticus]MCZ6393371.1 sodium:proton antiporter NhaD [Vibrio parahaemolyticus]HAS6605838.1 sodium:proton antiporter [Vibrio parahaemolyticus]
MPIYPIVAFCCLLFSSSSFAAASGDLNLVNSAVGYIALILFSITYILVMLEEYLKMRKSKPVLLAAGLIWILIGYTFAQHHQQDVAKAALEHNLLEYAELLLFLLVAMTYINAMEERKLFDALQAWMVGKGFGFKKLFWLTGFLAFVISPIADNLTTALLMCAVVMKVSGDNPRFVNLACINIVIAANAGGAFSPFGDITTLMVWQAGHVRFSEFMPLFVPSLINYVVPAFLMSLFVPNTKPNTIHEHVELKRGARRIVLLFVLTIATAVSFHAVLHFPPVVGMMMGLAYLQFFGYFLRKTLKHSLAKKAAMAIANGDDHALKRLGSVVPFDVFHRVSRAEWDTLLFFYGVVMCVGGLSLLGYLELVSNVMYTQWNPVWANVMVGVLSAIVDNIPVMFAVLTMDPSMSTGNWLLVTLTAGVGGSLLSIGSAAGVALMGAARGQYTFFGHLKWTPVIALGYAASIAAHLWMNGGLFT